MTPEFASQIALAGVALLTAAASGVAALGVRRLLGTADELKQDVRDHGERIAAMEVKLPNGEWRAIKDSLAGVQTNLQDLRTDLGTHILHETQALADVQVVMGNCKKMLAREFVVTGRMKPVKKSKV